MYVNTPRCITRFQSPTTPSSTIQSPQPHLKLGTPFFIPQHAISDEKSQTTFEVFKRMPYANRKLALSKMKEVRDSKDKNSIQGRKLAMQYNLMERAHKEKGPDAATGPSKKYADEFKTMPSAHRQDILDKMLKKLHTVDLNSQEGKELAIQYSGLKKLHAELKASRRSRSSPSAQSTSRRTDSGCPCPKSKRSPKPDAKEVAAVLKAFEGKLEEYRRRSSKSRKSILSSLKKILSTADKYSKEGRIQVIHYAALKQENDEIEASKNRSRSSPSRSSRPGSSRGSSSRPKSSRSTSHSTAGQIKSGCPCPESTRSPKPDPKEVATVLKAFEGKLEEYKRLPSEKQKSILSSLRTKLLSADKYSREGKILVIHYAALIQANDEMEGSKNRSGSSPSRSSPSRSSRAQPNSSQPKSSPPSAHSTTGQAFSSDPAALEIKRKQEAAQLAASQEREAVRMEQKQLKEAKELETKQWDESKRLEAKQLKEAQELEAMKQNEARQQAERQRREEEFQRVLHTKNMAERQHKLDADFEALAFKITPKAERGREKQNSTPSTAGERGEKSAPGKSCPCSEERRNSSRQSSSNTTGSTMKSTLDTTASSYRTAENDSSFGSSPKRPSSVPKASPKRPSTATGSSQKRSSSKPETPPNRSSSPQKSSSKRSSSSKSKRESRSPSPSSSPTSRREKSVGCPCPKSSRSSSRPGVSTGSSEKSLPSKKPITSQPPSSGLNRPTSSVRSKTPPREKSSSRPSRSTQRAAPKPSASTNVVNCPCPPAQRRYFSPKWTPIRLGRVLPSPPRTSPPAPPRTKSTVTPPTPKKKVTPSPPPGPRSSEIWSPTAYSPPHSDTWIEGPPILYGENGERDMIAVYDWILSLSMQEMDEYFRQRHLMRKPLPEKIS